MQPKYTIIAGVNGAGKSSIFQFTKLNNTDLGTRINVDELIKNEYKNQWNDNKVQIEASKRIVKLINDCIKNKISFNQETTLSGSSIFNNIKKAKEQGFQIELNYVGLNNSDLAIKRVNERVNNGGHGVPRELIIERYSNSLENLNKIILICDSFSIYDNSKIPEKILVYQNYRIEYINPIIPDYYKDIIIPFTENLKNKEIENKTKLSLKEIVSKAKNKSSENNNDYIKVNIEKNKERQI